MTDAPKLAAWRVTIKSWAGVVSIYAAERRAKAIVEAYRGCNDAGYSIPWQDFVAHRDPRFDELAASAKPGECLGWSNAADGTTWGCMRPAEDQVRHLIGYAWINQQLELTFRTSRAGVPMATLGNLASVAWFKRSQKYRVFEPYPGDAQKRTDFKHAAEAAEYLKGLTT